MEDTVLGVDGAARLLDVSHDTIYRLARNGMMPGRKVGSQWRFSKAVLFAWLRDATVEERSHSAAPVDSPHQVDPLNDESMQEQSQPDSTISKG